LAGWFHGAADRTVDEKVHGAGVLFGQGATQVVIPNRPKSAILSVSCGGMAAPVGERADYFTGLVLDNQHGHGVVDGRLLIVVQADVLVQLGFLATATAN
jgi:hypothetical protein